MSATMTENRTSTYRDIKNALRKIGARYGYKGFAGGWIYKDGQPVAQGWRSLENRWRAAGILSGDWNGVTVDWDRADVHFGVLSLDALTRKLTAFGSFEEMLSVPGRYRPTILPRDAEHVRLADAYDAAQEDRGDPRRAYRGR